MGKISDYDQAYNSVITIVNDRRSKIDVLLEEHNKAAQACNTMHDLRFPAPLFLTTDPKAKRA